MGLPGLNCITKNFFLFLTFSQNNKIIDFSLPGNPEFTGELHRFKISSVAGSLLFLSFFFFFLSVPSDCFNKESSSDRLISTLTV